jgi:hypothetical protein
MKEKTMDIESNELETKAGNRQSALTVNTVEYIVPH